MIEFTLLYRYREDIPNRNNKPSEIKIKIRANSQSDAIQQGYSEAVRQSSNYMFVEVINIQEISSGYSSYNNYQSGSSGLGKKRFFRFIIWAILSFTLGGIIISNGGEGFGVFVIIAGGIVSIIYLFGAFIAWIRH